MELSFNLREVMKLTGWKALKVMSTQNLYSMHNCILSNCCKPVEYILNRHWAAIPSFMGLQLLLLFRKTNFPVPKAEEMTDDLESSPNKTTTAMSDPSETDPTTGSSTNNTLTLLKNFRHRWRFFATLHILKSMFQFWPKRSRPKPHEDEEMVALPYVKKRIKQNLKVGQKHIHISIHQSSGMHLSNVTTVRILEIQ